MRANGITTLCLAGLSALSMGCATAQELTRTDQMAAAMLKEKPRSAVLILEATLLQQGNPQRCNGFNIHLKSTEGKTVVASSGSISVAEAGEYTAWRAICGPWVGVRGEEYDGPFARIRLVAGEIVNAGKLVIDYKLENGLTGKKSYRVRSEGLSPAQVAQLKEKAPRTFGKAIKRPLTALKVTNN